MKRIFLLFMAMAAACSFGQTAYDAASIPEHLKQGANAVKRFEEISFEVTDIDRAVYNVHQVYTVLNKQGDDELSFNEWTTKYRLLEEVEIKVYNQDGLQTGRFKKKDLTKYTQQDGLIEDGVNYYLKAGAGSYPVTVEFIYQMKYRGTLSYPMYRISTPDESTQQSTFTVKVPAALGLRYKAQKITLDPQQISDGSNIVYKWSVGNLPAVKAEVGGADPSYSCSSILIAPNSFQFYDSRGKMNSWKDFGSWEQGLLTGLDGLPADRVAFFADLTKAAPSEREKVRLVYDYLQRNFRYVSIQLGIGGVKPFPASFTDEKKYGDCKGLSFYMYSVLRSLGIKSHVALINAKYNKEPVDQEFPMNRFNHMILCVPQQKDSIWLECTSKTIDFGRLGSFTENRNALLITENGGVLVPTPRSEASQNSWAATTDINLREDGAGTTKTLLSSKGEYKEMMNYITAEKKDNQKKLIVNYLGFSQPDEFAILDKSHGLDCNTEVNLSIEKIPQFSAGSKMFLSPRIYAFFNEKLPLATGRTQDYYFEQPYEKTDTTIYHLPADFTVDALPRPVDRKCAYAAYSTDFVYDKEKNQLTSMARLVLNSNRIPAEKYAEVKNFFDEVIGNESQKLVIKKN